MMTGTYAMGPPWLQFANPCGSRADDGPNLAEAWREHRRDGEAAFGTRELGHRHVRARRQALVVLELAAHGPRVLLHLAEIADAHRRAPFGDLPDQAVPHLHLGTHPLLIEAMAPSVGRGRP